jgi:predicted nucleic acid-binding protein
MKLIVSELLSDNGREDKLINAIVEEHISTIEPGEYYLIYSPEFPREVEAVILAKRQRRARDENGYERRRVICIF